MQLQATTKLCYISGDLMLTGRVWVAKRRLYSWRVTAQMIVLTVGTKHWS